MKKIITLLAILFTLSLAASTPAKAKDSAYIDTFSVMAGKTETFKVYDNKTDKQLKGNYTWSIKSPGKNLYIVSGKHSSAVKVKCKKFGMKLKGKTKRPWVPYIKTAKLQCKIKNSKGKVIYKKSFYIMGILNYKHKVIYLTPDTTKTITLKAPHKKNFFAVQSDFQADSKIASDKYNDPFKHSFKGSSIKLPGKNGDAVVTIRPNSQKKQKMMSLDYYTDDCIYETVICVTKKKFATIEKDKYDKIMDEAMVSDMITPIVLSKRKRPSSIQKGNLFCVSCGTQKGTTYKIISGKNLVSTVRGKKEYKAGNNYKLLKRIMGKDAENSFDSRSNAYVTCGVYKAKKSGTVKIQVTYPDKTTKTMKIKIL